MPFQKASTRAGTKYQVPSDSQGPSIHGAHILVMEENNNKLKKYIYIYIIYTKFSNDIHTHTYIHIYIKEKIGRAACRERV